MVVRSRDSRRRRVMLDESVQSSAAAAPTAAASASPRKRNAKETHKPRRLYGYGAERRSQPKTTDLLPKRWPAFTTVIVALIASLGFLNVIAIYSDTLGTYIGDAGAAAISLQGTGTLAAWFSSALMATSAAICWQIYFLRKHRCSDYRGSYRLWCWVAPLFLLGSVAGSVDTAGIVQALGQTLQQAAGQALPSVGPISAICLLLCSGLTVMSAVGIWETRTSRGSIALVAMAWLVGVGSLLAKTPTVSDWIDEAGATTLASNGWPVFATLTLLALLTYARYVYLAANGMLPARANGSNELANSKPAAAKPVTKPTVAATSKTKKPAAKKSPAKKTAKTQSDQPKPVAVPAPDATPAAVLQMKAKSEPAQDAEEAPTLSKAERRRQRKLQRRQNRAA